MGCLPASKGSASSPNMFRANGSINHQQRNRRTNLVRGRSFNSDHLSRQPAPCSLRGGLSLSRQRNYQLRDIEFRSFRRGERQILKPRVAIQLEDFAHPVRAHRTAYFQRKLNPFVQVPEGQPNLRREGNLFDKLNMRHVSHEPFPLSAQSQTSTIPERYQAFPVQVHAKERPG